MKKFVLFFILLTAALQANNWEDYKYRTFIIQKRIPGWCSTEKANKMMDLIYGVKPKICVEIGVFGGSSVYPMAKALKYLRNGIIYAIDPWTNEECTDGYDKNDPNYRWWDRVNLEKIYKGFLGLIKQRQLTNFCHPMRMTAEQASKFFKDESIDILHIDGNHSEQKALSDVKRFLPKVKKGGYIWFDDCDWPTTAKAISYLKKFAIVNEEKSLQNKSCLLFKKM